MFHEHKLPQHKVQAVCINAYFVKIKVNNAWGHFVAIEGRFVIVSNQADVQVVHVYHGIYIVCVAGRIYRCIWM